MGAFLPSEVARLVLGYLEDQGCTTAYEEFLNQSPHLDECRGRGFFTRIMGLSLDDILDEYCAIHSYVVGMKCSVEFKRKVVRCRSLLEKVKLFVEKNDISEELEVKNEKLSQSLLSSRESPPRLSTGRLRRRRNNSCDSLVTLNTESTKNVVKRLSHDRIDKCSAYLNASKLCGNNLGRSVESLVAEATHLADLPGNSVSRVIKNDASKDDGTSSSNNNKSIKSNVSKEGKVIKKTLSLPNDLNKLDQVVNVNGSAPLDTEEENFRKALGLVKHCDIAKSNNAKTPLKRKVINQRLAMSARKFNPTIDNFPNESLDVTTIQNAMLDCTELHEKIAENINKLYNTTCKSIEADISSIKSPQVAKMEMSTESRKNLPELSAVVDDPQLKSVIKQIVENTEKDPLFDLLLNEVLAASIETTSGTESDVLSRPSTSTPEKSCRSPNNEYSPAPSWKSHSILASDQPSGVRTRSDQSVNNKEHTNTCSKSDEPPNSFKPIHLPSPILSETKIYPRFPRGGKKMDILRENYRSSLGYIAEDSCTQPSPESIIDDVSRSPDRVSPVNTDKKVIILSNERVRTSILSTNGSIVIQKTNDDNSNQEKKDNEAVCSPSVSHVTASSTENSNKTLKGKPRCINVPPTKILETSPVPAETMLPTSSRRFPPHQTERIDNYSREKCNSSLPSVGTCSMPSVADREIYSGNPTAMVTPQPVGSTASNLKSFRRNVVTGRPPELVISNGRVRTSIPRDMNAYKDDSLFTKEDILKMPTIIMLQPIENSNGTSHLQFPNINMNSNVSLSEANNLKNLIKATPIIPTVNSGLDHGIKPFNSSARGSEGVNINNQLSLNLTGTKPLPLLPAVVDVSNIITDNYDYQPTVNPGTIQNDTSAGQSLLMIKKNEIKTSGQVENESEFIFPKKNTPDVAITKKVSASTPRRNFSHVRVLDFNTPHGGSRVTRKANTSPKLSYKYCPNTVHKSDGSNILTSPLSHRSKAIKSCLFKTVTEAIPEIDLQAMTPDKVQPDQPEVQVSKVWDQVQGVGHIIKNDVEVVDKSNIAINPAGNISKSKVLSEEEQKRLDEGAAEWARIRNIKNNCWDQSLRAYVQPLDYTQKQIKRVPKKHYRKGKGVIKNKKTPKKIKVSAKRIEDALLDKSKESCSEASLIINTSASAGDKTEDPSQDELEIVEMSSVVNVNCNVLELLGCQKEEVEAKNVLVQSSEIVSNDKNRDHHIHLKSLRDLYSQQKSNIKSTENPIEEEVEKVVVKKPKVKGKSRTNTFKVKINCKNLSDDKHDSINSENSSRSERNKNKENNKKESSKSKDNNRNKESKPAKTAQNEAADTSSAKSKSKAKTKKKIEKVEEVEEPAVPAIKITPDMPRDPTSQHFGNAKCNLNSIFDTPFKASILDMSMDTPKFMTPGPMPASLLKILEFPTPNFGTTPIMSTRITGKEQTPSSYSSRPTDYSGGSSYYKPDEIEDFYNDFENVTLNKRTPAKTVNVLEPIEEKPEVADENPHVSTRVLRPRPPSTNNTSSLTKKSPKVAVKKVTKSDNTSKQRKDNQSLELKEKKLLTNDSQNHQIVMSEAVNESNFFPNDSSSSDSSCSSTSSSSSSSSSSSEADSCVKSTKKPNKTPMKEKPAHQNSTSAPCSKSVYNPKASPEIQNTSSKFSRDVLATRKMLEEKRLRVISKLNNRLISPKKMVKVGKKKVSPLKTRNNVTRVSCKPKQLSTEVNMNSIPVVVVSPMKLASDKKLDMVETKSTHSKSFELQTPPILKSRRKSSTPRKLEAVNFESVDSLPQVFVKRHVKDIPKDIKYDVKVDVTVHGNVSNPVVKTKEPKANDNLNENIKLAEDIDGAEKLNHLIEEEVFPSLHLSSDEADADVCKPAKRASESDELMQIKNFIEESAQPEKTEFRVNLEKQGYDESTAKKIEQCLSDPAEDTEISMDADDANSNSTLGSYKIPLKSGSRRLDKSSHKLRKSKTPVKSQNRSKTHYRPIVTPEKSTGILKSRGEVKSMRKLKKSPKKTNGSTPSKQQENDEVSSSASTKSESVVNKSDSEATLVQENDEVSSSVSTKSESVVNKSDSEPPPPLVQEPLLPKKDVTEILDGDTNNTEDEDEEIQWGKYECTQSDYNYHFYNYNKVYKTKNKTRSPSYETDLDTFTLNATLYDTALGRDVESAVTASEHYTMFDIDPDPLLRRRKIDYERRQKKIESESKGKLAVTNPLKILIDEMSNDSDSSLSPIEDISDRKDSTSIVLIRSEIITAVSTILVPDDNRFVFADSDIHSESPLLSKENISPDPLKNIRQENCSTPEIDTMCDVNVKSTDKIDCVGADGSELSKSIDTDGTLSTKQAEKRKCDDDEENSDAKKAKPLIPQNILKKIGIESVLSQLHGPES